MGNNSHINQNLVDKTILKPKEISFSFLRNPFSWLESSKQPKFK